MCLCQSFYFFCEYYCLSFLSPSDALSVIVHSIRFPVDLKPSLPSPVDLPLPSPLVPPPSSPAHPSPHLIAQGHARSVPHAAVAQERLQLASAPELGVVLHSLAVDMGGEVLRILLRGPTEAAGRNGSAEVLPSALNRLGVDFWVLGRDEVLVVVHRKMCVSQLLERDGAMVAKPLVRHDPGPRCDVLLDDGGEDGVVAREPVKRDKAKARPRDPVAVIPLEHAQHPPYLPVSVGYEYAGGREREWMSGDVLFLFLYF